MTGSSLTAGPGAWRSASLWSMKPASATGAGADGGANGALLPLAGHGHGRGAGYSLLHKEESIGESGSGMAAWGMARCRWHVQWQRHGMYPCPPVDCRGKSNALTGPMSLAAFWRSCSVTMCLKNEICCSSYGF